MRAYIYRQSFPDRYTVRIDTRLGEYQKMLCEDCGGLGIYEIYDDTSICNVCKGDGYEWVNVY